MRCQLRSWSRIWELQIQISSRNRSRIRKYLSVPIRAHTSWYHDNSLGVKILSHSPFRPFKPLTVVFVAYKVKEKSAIIKSIGANHAHAKPYQQGTMTGKSCSCQTIPTGNNNCQSLLMPNHTNREQWLANLACPPPPSRLCRIKIYFSLSRKKIHQILRMWKECKCPLTTFYL